MAKGEVKWAAQVGKQLSEIYHTGHIDLDYRVWDDLRFPATSTRSAAGAPGFTAFTGGILALMFDKSTDEQVYLNAQMPHAWATGTNIHPHVHWSPMDDQATAKVVWGLEYSIGQSNGPMSAPVIITGSTTLNGVDLTGGIHYITELGGTGGIDMSSYTGLSTMVICRLFRDANHGDDNYDNDAALFEFDLHYEIDTMGSWQEYTKKL